MGVGKYRKTWYSGPSLTYDNLGHWSHMAVLKYVRESTQKLLECVQNYLYFLATLPRTKSVFHRCWLNLHKKDQHWPKCYVSSFLGVGQFKNVANIMSIRKKKYPFESVYVDASVEHDLRPRFNKWLPQELSLSTLTNFFIILVEL